MRPRKIIRTTLGDLIISLTDQVAPLVSDRSGIYSVVGFLLSDLLTHHRVPADERSRRTCLAFGQRIRAGGNEA
jgi:hypothetical protein